MPDKPVLFKITNLKQYFPLKKKGLYVKANDGITIDIYDGETLGLVGESGCGKSTMGRTLLKLYNATDGKIMYNGRSILDVVPAYAYKTVHGLKAAKARMLQLQAELEKAENNVSSHGYLAEDAKETPERFKAMAELADARKAAYDATFDVTSIVGGLITQTDLDPVITAYVALLDEAKERKRLRDKRRAQKLEYDDTMHRAGLKSGGGKRLEGKAAGIEETIRELDRKILESDEKLRAAMLRIDQLRAPHLHEPLFQEYDRDRDTSVDLARLTYDEMRRLRVDMQLIFQDPYSSLDSRMTIGQIIGEGLLAHKRFKRNDDRMKAKVLKTMEDCGLAPYFLHRYPHQFSGGQRQRIGIARALSLSPKFDEAVSALDVSIRADHQPSAGVKDGEHLTTVLTHDLAVVKYISDRIAVMYLGVIVELASTEDIFSSPMHPYTEALLSAIPTADENARRELVVLEGDIPSPVNPPPGCKFHTRCKYATDICKHVTPVLEEITPKHFVACHHRLSPQQQADINA